MFTHQQAHLPEQAQERRAIDEQVQHCICKTHISIMDKAMGMSVSSVALSDGPFGDVPLSRERSSALGKGRTCEELEESQGTEKSTDVAGSKDLEIETGLASWVADDLLRTLAGGVDTSTGTGVGTVDKIPLKSASGATHAVTKHCCVLLSRG